jgi:hypothetical protein
MRRKMLVKCNILQVSKLNLTLQVYGNGVWQDAMSLSFAEPAEGFLGPCRFAYKSAYVHANLDAYQSPFALAVSARLPLDFDSISLPAAPAFLYDIAPSGAARRFLIAHMGRAGQVDWRAACDALADILNPHDAFERLRQDARQLRALPDLLRDSGLPQATFNHPAIVLNSLDQRLLAWGLQ